jgi:hypothetical protein
VDPRERFGLYRLCKCPECEGRGKVWEYAQTGSFDGDKQVKCPECRGEGRIRQELAACESPEAVGVALVTLAREDEWKDANGDPCAFGLLDRMPEGKDTGTWLISPWKASARNVSDAGRVLALSKART